MNGLILTLNRVGSQLSEVIWPVFVQSSLLIALVWGLDRIFRRKISPAVRYALWLVVLVKLVAPPSLALPSGVAWWLRTSEPERRQAPVVLVTTGASSVQEEVTRTVAVPAVAAPVELSRKGLALIGFAVVSVGLVIWAGVRWRGIAKKIRGAAPGSERLHELLDQVLKISKVGWKPDVRVMEEPMSPALCGLVRPCILLPLGLVERLSDEQLKAVLLHELMHLRRGDVWVNCAQMVLQAAYWWHPLVWFANARIRDVREEAVDDAVVVALQGDSMAYAPTLLEVAKMALDRPLAALGLVGILEGKSALRQRIERLLNGTVPRKAGLTVLSFLGVLVFTAVAIPMGQPPAQAAKEKNVAAPPGTVTVIGTNPVPGDANVMRVDSTLVLGGGNVVTQSLVISTNIAGAKPLVKIQVKLVEVAGVDPAAEPADSPLRLLPSEMVNGNGGANSPTLAALRSKFVQPENLRFELFTASTVTNVLTEEEAQRFIKRLEARPESDILSAPVLTTVDGRQGRIQVGESKTVVTGFELKPQKRAGGSGSQVSYFITNVMAGVGVDLVPKIEGNAIRVSAQPHLLEFIGYQKPENTNIISGEKDAKSYVRPLPYFRVVDLAAAALVPSGQTLMIAGPVYYDTGIMKDKVPVLGDVPVLGRLFRSESRWQRKKHLIVLITPTVVEAAVREKEAH